MWIPKIENTEKPLYLAICDILEADIQAGILKPGEKLPPQRDIADALHINLSTVTRAFRQCEMRGLISGIVGRGTFISSDAKVPLSMVSLDEKNTPSETIIDLGQVLPFYHLDAYVADRLKEISHKISFGALLRYPDPAGIFAHRQIGAKWLSQARLQTSAEEVLITSGSQSGLSIALLSLFSPGDRIAVDQMTYPGMKSLGAQHGIRLVPVEMDEEGMKPEVLSQLCYKETIKGIYQMAGVQNPTGRTSSPHRKKVLAEVIQKHQLLLLEDDAYSYTGEPNGVPLSALIPDQSIFLSGTSKLLGPGFRISFLRVPSRYYDSMKKGILTTTWMASPITAEYVCALISDGTAASISERKREEGRRRNLLSRQILGDYEISGVPCGFFQWVTLPERWKGKTRLFEAIAREKGVIIFCADKFTVGSGSVPDTFRIALSAPENEETLKEGLTILKELLDHGYEEEMIR